MEARGLAQSHSRGEGQSQVLHPNTIKYTASIFNHCVGLFYGLFLSFMLIAGINIGVS